MVTCYGWLKNFALHILVAYISFLFLFLTMDPTTCYPPYSCVGEPITLSIRLSNAILPSSVYVTSHMMFVDELNPSSAKDVDGTKSDKVKKFKKMKDRLKKNRNYRRQKSYQDMQEDNDPNDIRNLTNRNLLGVRSTKNVVVDGQIVVTSKLIRVPEEDHIKPKEHRNTTLYAVVLSPKRWRYTGLGSKMNDKQAMTNAPVVSLAHASEIPKGCLVTLRTLVRSCLFVFALCTAGVIY